MEENYTVINIRAGIGTMSWAFGQKGFKVLYNLTDRQEYKDVIQQHFESKVELIQNVDFQDLPNADIVIGKFVSSFSVSNLKKLEMEIATGFRRDIFEKMLIHMRPRAFLFNLGAACYKNEFFQYLVNQFTKNRYICLYESLKPQTLIGVPVSEQNLYFAAIRKEDSSQFEFPYYCSKLLPVEAFLEDTVNSSYEVNGSKILEALDENGLYTWKWSRKNRGYQKSNVINTVSNIPIVKKSECIRYMTERELARLKGIPDSYNVNLKNKRQTYRAIWAESNVQIISLLAEEIHKMLTTADTVRTLSQDVPENKNQKMKEECGVERRYDVFVSSTYTDLIEERKEVTQAILECDCMPVGMEMFPASNLEQWNFIKKVIEKSDIYLVVIAGRYGSESINESGNEISYTEMEFDYAVKLGKPVLAFLIDDINKLERGKTETDSHKMELLERFKEKVKTKRMVKFYKNKDDLKFNVMSSLNYKKKQINEGGWVRASECAGLHVEKKVQELEKEKTNLQEENVRLLNDIKKLKMREQELMQKYTCIKKKLNSMDENVRLFERQLKDFEVYIETELKEV